MILIDFRDFGPVAPRAYNREDLQEILASSQALLADFTPEDISEFLCDWTATLMWSAISEGSVDDTWYDRAVIVLCLRGLRGELQPKFLNFNSRD
jgi:hypothetical protein